MCFPSLLCLHTPPCLPAIGPRSAWSGLIRIFLFTEPFCLANYPSAFHSVMFNPVEPRLLATANSKEGVGLWDIRKPQRWAPFIQKILPLFPAWTLKKYNQPARVVGTWLAVDLGWTPPNVSWFLWSQENSIPKGQAVWDIHTPC